MSDKKKQSYSEREVMDPAIADGHLKTILDGDVFSKDTSVLKLYKKTEYILGEVIASIESVVEEIPHLDDFPELNASLIQLRSYKTGTIEEEKKELNELANTFSAYSFKKTNEKSTLEQRIARLSEERKSSFRHIMLWFITAIVPPYLALSFLQESTLADQILYACTIAASVISVIGIMAESKSLYINQNNRSEIAQLSQTVDQRESYMARARDVYAYLQVLHSELTQMSETLLESEEPRQNHRYMKALNSVLYNKRVLQDLLVEYKPFLKIEDERLIPSTDNRISDEYIEEDQQEQDEDVTDYEQMPSLKKLLLGK